MMRRRGATLLDVLVALPLLLLLGALAVQGFVTQLRLVTVQEARLANVRELEHAALALAADLRPLSAWDLESWSDSAITATVPVLTGYVCGAPAPQVIDVAVGNPDAAARAVVLADVRAGDVFGWAGVDSVMVGSEPVALDSARRQFTIDAVASAAAACADSPIRGAAAPWRLTLSAAPAAVPLAGTPITIARRTEWKSYRAVDGAHYLGRRDWNGVAWSTVQPVAGPLQAPALGGMVLQLLRTNGTHATAALGDARQVDLVLRAPRGSTGTDSLRVRLALRGSGG